ncbi:MAG: histidine triad nucleotide-binding protein [Gemmatimonadetes bacterium]|nr:histidine triad nucleotide-binding protein [Gemmatimonadota bacterium]
MGDCLFCRIGRGEIPATKVTETKTFYAFRDLNPQAPVHVLAIPREHVASLNEAMDAGLLGGLLLFARDVARAEGLADRGYRVVLNTNTDGGQTVFHLHAHILGGRAMKWPPG